MIKNQTTFRRESFASILMPTVVLLLLLFTNLSAMGDNKLIFEQANNLYRECKYEQAMELYSKIQDKNAVVNYNLGNCEYKLNKLGLAHLYWRRAEKNWGIFNRTELLNNLSLLKEKLNEQENVADGKDAKSENVLKSLRNIKLQITSFIRATPLFSLQIVFLSLWLFLVISMRNLFRRRKKLLIGTLFTFIAIFGLMLISKYNFEYRRSGIVITSDAKLLSGPGENYQVLGFVTQAKEVTIQKKSSDFYKIKINGQIGWISQASVEEI